MLTLAVEPSRQAAFDFAFLREPCEIALRVAPGASSRFRAWLGRSGRRYVVSAFSVESDESLGFADAVLIAVNADRKVIAARESGPWGVEAALCRWREDMVREGAVELHVHLIAPNAPARRRVMMDLSPECDD